MLYIKIERNGEIVSAEAMENPVYVCRQARNHIIIRCQEYQAQGILSKNSSEIYQLTGKESLNLENPGYATVIYQDEYDRIIADMDQQETDDEEEKEQENPDEGKMTIAQMREKITALEETVTSLTETNDMLSECILEMSEIIYA